MLQNPDSGKIPAIASTATRKVTAVTGIRRARPPILQMSLVPSAWITLPAPRKSSVLNAAWVVRWKRPGRVSADAQREHHVPELADRGVREHPLDVILRDGDAGGEDRGERAEGGHHAQGVGAGLEDAVQPGHHEHARGHHRGGVDERRDRRRALHGVGQPDVQRELAALADGPAEQEERHQGHPALRQAAAADEPRHLPEIERARRGCSGAGCR